MPRTLFASGRIPARRTRYAMSPNVARLLTLSPSQLPKALQDHWRRVDNVQWLRTARLGMIGDDGVFGGPEHCRTVMRNCEAEMVSRPTPWPWEA